MLKKEGRSQLNSNIKKQLPKFIFITGLAGSGKTTAVQIIKKQLSKVSIPFLVLSDEEMLFQLHLEDQEELHHYHPVINQECFLLKDNHFFDEGLSRINKELESINKRRIPVMVLVELARGSKSQALDVTYKRALQIIDKSIIKKSLIIYLETPFDLRMKRNQTRGKNGEHTPKQIMREIYKTDDISILRNRSLNIIRVLNNKDKQGLERSLNQILLSETKRQLPK